MHLSCTVFELSYLSKGTHFNLLQLHLAPQLEATPFKFHGNLWCQKTRVSELLCGIGCMIPCLAILTQYRCVMDGQTDT